MEFARGRGLGPSHNQQLSLINLIFFNPIKQRPHLRCLMDEGRKRKPEEKKKINQSNNSINSLAQREKNWLELFVGLAAGLLAPWCGVSFIFSIGIHSTHPSLNSFHSKDSFHSLFNGLLFLSLFASLSGAVRPAAAHNPPKEQKDKSSQASLTPPLISSNLSMNFKIFFINVGLAHPPMEQQLFLSFNQINFKFDLMKEKGWTVPLGPKPFKFNQSTINLPIRKRRLMWLMNLIGRANLALQLLNKSISRCSIALLFNN